MLEYVEPENDAEFIDPGEIGEVVEDDPDAVEPQDDAETEHNDDADAAENIEIDLSNNLWTYFDRHSDSVFTVFGHPTLPMVASGGGDSRAFLWTTHTQPPRFVAELLKHTESVVCGAFSSDGRFVITGDMEGVVYVHKASKLGEKWAKFGELHEVAEVLWISVHPRLPYFAFGGPDGLVWVYHLDEEVSPVLLGFAHTMECNGGVFMDTDEVSLVTVAEDGLVVHWNAAGVAFKLQPHDDFKGVESPWVSVSAHGSVVACGARNGQLAVVNVESRRVVAHLRVSENEREPGDLLVEALAWCGSVNLLACGLVLGDVLFFDTSRWALRRLVHVDDAVTRLEFVGALPMVLALTMAGRVHQWDARTGAEVFAGYGHNMGILDFALVGDKVVTAGDEGVSLVYQLEG